MYINWISIEGTISPNFIKGYSLAIKPIFSKIWKFLILLYLSSFPSKNNILWLFVAICSRVSVKTSNNKQKWMIFYYFCVFMKTVGFSTVFIADMNSACKNTLVSVYLLNFHRRHNFGLAIQPIFSKIWKCLILLYLSSFPSKNNILWLFVAIYSRVSVKPSNN